MVFNVRVTNLGALVRARRERGAMRDNVDLRFVKRYESTITAATERIVSTLRAENPDRTLLVLMDAPRANIYEDVPVSDAGGWMWDTMRSACEHADVPFVDMTEPFARMYAETGRRFNSRYDYHWNEHGHRAAAHVLHDALVEIGVTDAGSTASAAYVPPSPADSRKTARLRAVKSVHATARSQAGSPTPQQPKSITAASRPSRSRRFDGATSPWIQTGTPRHADVSASSQHARAAATSPVSPSTPSASRTSPSYVASGPPR